MTTVINIRIDNHYDVYIGRPCRGIAGPFGNPVVINEVCPVCDEIHTKAADTIPCYKEYLEWRVDCDSEFRQLILELKGKVLGCFCKPRDCHGDIIVEWLEKNDE